MAGVQASFQHAQQWFLIDRFSVDSSGWASWNGVWVHFVRKVCVCASSTMSEFFRTFWTVSRLAHMPGYERVALRSFGAHPSRQKPQQKHTTGRKTIVEQLDDSDIPNTDWKSIQKQALWNKIPCMQTWMDTQIVIQKVISCNFYVEIYSTEMSGQEIEPTFISVVWPHLLGVRTVQRDHKISRPVKESQSRASWSSENIQMQLTSIQARLWKENNCNTDWLQDCIQTARESLSPKQATSKQALHSPFMISKHILTYLCMF